MMRSGFRNWLWPSALVGLAWMLGKDRGPLARLWDVPVTLETRDGSLVTARLRDIHGPGDVFGLGEYDFDVIDWRRVRYVIDVGAHVGAFTIWLASRAPCLVLALEPNPATFQLLEQNVERGAMGSRVVLQQAALAGESGPRKLSVRRFSTDATILEAHAAADAVPVKALRLVDVMRMSGFPEIDLLKIDVEGAEYEVFANLEPHALDRARALIVECHFGTGGDHGSIIERLKGDGFEVAAEVAKSDSLLVAWRRDDDAGAPSIPRLGTARTSR
jgi:FkbM family methyltransferase